MIDLHLHLDGSLTPSLVRKLAEEQNIVLDAGSDTELMNLLKAPKHCRSLNDYLTRFELPLTVLQTKSAILECTKDLVYRLNEQGLIYAEIRFAPQLHMRNGLSMEDVIEAAVSGIDESNWSRDVRPQLILCLMRGAENHQENMQTVRLAKRYLGVGVAAVDLAGAEAIYKTSLFSSEFKLAKELGVPFTIHAGEADGAASVWTAVELGAVRIGHGISVMQDEKLLKVVTEKNILLEMCPTSNIQTGAVKSLSAHPVAKLLRQGACVCINTDNMTVSDTSIKKEFDIISAEFSLSSMERRQLLVHAVNGAFVTDTERLKLLHEINAYENEI